MAKQSGLGDQLFVAGYDISGDIGAIDTIDHRSGVLDVTAINASGHERIHSLVDGEITFKPFFNDAALQEHVALAAKGSGADRVVSYFHGSTIGNAAAGLVAKQINYDWERSADGGLAGTVQCLANGKGLDFCEQLTAGKRTDTAATVGTALDSGIVGGTALGLAAYLQVFSFTGTSVTVVVEQSSDNAVGDPYAAILTFTAATGITAERKITAALTTAVERYLRVTTTGTFNPATFAVCASRYPYAL